MKTLTGTLATALLLVVGTACSSGSDANTKQTALAGDFVAGGLLADSAQDLPYGDGLVVHFDGAGTASWTGVGKAFPDFPYGDRGNGSVTLDADLKGVLSPDGELLVLGSAPGASGPEYWALVKASPDMRIGAWRGDYLGFAVGARNGGPCWLETVRLTPDGMGIVAWTVVGRAHEATGQYGMRDGVLSVFGSPVDTSEDHTTGALTRDGNVVLLTDIDAPDRGFMIAVRRSTQGMASAWQGTYECVQFGLDTSTPVCWTARVTLEADGAGGYAYRLQDSFGEVETGAGTYVQAPDGTLTLDIGVPGIVSPDGDTVLLGLDAGAQMSLVVGTRR